MSQVTDELLASLVELDVQRKECKAELDRLNEERSAIEAIVLDEWERNGTTSVKANGKTIYLSSRKWWKAKDDNRAAVVVTLQQLGFTDYVTFNTQSLSSYCNEQEKMGEELPAELLAVTTQSENFIIKTRGH